MFYNKAKKKIRFLCQKTFCLLTKIFLPVHPPCIVCTRIRFHFLKIKKFLIEGMFGALSRKFKRIKLPSFLFGVYAFACRFQCKIDDTNHMKRYFEPKTKIS